MNNNFAISWRICYSLQSCLTCQIMVPTIVIALINCWEHMYNWFENLVYAFCIFIGNDFCDQLSVADCPSWIHGTSTELPSLRYRRQLLWLGWAWRRALTHRALCPLMSWSRLTNLWVPWGWFHTAEGSELHLQTDIVQLCSFIYRKGLTYVSFEFTIGLESTQ